MQRIATTVGALAFVSAVTGSVALALNPGSFDPAAAVFIVAGQLTASATAFTGLVLTRAPWGRWGLVGVTTLGLILGAIGGDILFAVATVAGAAAIVGLTGPWLRLWSRRLPAADAPGPVPTALVAAAPVSILYVGIAALDHLSPWHIALTVVTVAGSVAYGNGASTGLWTLRVATPAIGAVAAASSTAPGGFAIAAGVVTLTVLAWLPQARRVTAVVTPPVPEPHRRRKDTA